MECSGFEVKESCSHVGAYAPPNKISRAGWLPCSITENFFRALIANKYDLRFLQRNLTATLLTSEPLLRKPFIFDVDDAIFLGKRGKNAERIARLASLTICGNAFLADHFCRFGPVVILPTAVDANRYLPFLVEAPKPMVIGWSGSSSGLKYLYEIEPAIFSLLQKYPHAVLKIVSDKSPDFKKLPIERVVYERWTADREVAVLQEFSVGIMPLEDSLWARGKCSFKMLTYMAVGIPVVVSPVGMNSEILSQAHCGFGPKNNDEWVDAVSCLLDDPSLSKLMGKCGRKLIEDCYSKDVIGPKLSSILKSQI